MAMPFSELISLLHPSGGPHPIVMYRAYLDESGDAPEPKTFAVGGFWGKAPVWKRLQDRWLALLPRGIEYFHATECFSGNGQFINMTFKQREELLDRITDLICSRAIHLLAATVDVPTYRSFAPKAKRNSFGGNKYNICLETVIECACHWSGGVPQEIDGRADGRHDSCAFIMESSDYDADAAQVFRDLRTNKSESWTSRIGAEIFGDKRGPQAIPLLQVADFGAFLAAKISANSPDRGEISWRKYYEKLTAAKRVGKITKWDKTSLQIIYDLYQNSPPASLSGFLGDVTESLP